MATSKRTQQLAWSYARVCDRPSAAGDVAERTSVRTSAHASGCPERNLNARPATDPSERPARCSSGRLAPYPSGRPALCSPADLIYTASVPDIAGVEPNLARVESQRRPPISASVLGRRVEGSSSAPCLSFSSRPYLQACERGSGTFFPLTSG
ncbi:hypothetical protein BD626DRAFT_99168 [Schizophyllum amplum]|uniref:Uncharacterized protein n=1 Tax=Schizophyllum amplum TaxID=97359 RepID=A0A550CR97_9AGAR|nr:hypothetical protein BD626DRAFT_99168 [Auriculariopsis ampla]